MKQSLNNIRFLLVLPSVLLLFSLTGCWSSHVIEELGFEVGLAFDKGKESTVEKALEEEGGRISKKEPYNHYLSIC